MACYLVKHKDDFTILPNYRVPVRHNGALRGYVLSVAANMFNT
jgi:hypothetical protein